MSTAAASRVLKSGSARHAGESAYNFIDLRQRCDAYAADIREQCRGWIVEARGECDAIRDRARKEGFAAGREEGLADAESEIARRAAEDAAGRTEAALRTATPAVRAAAESLETEREQWRGQWEMTAVQLAVAIAGRLTQQQIAANPALLIGRSRELLMLASGRQDAVLRMHPDDLAALGDAAADVTAGTPAKLVPDESVEPGGCVLQTDAGDIDGQLSTQLERFGEELLA